MAPFTVRVLCMGRGAPSPFSVELSEGSIAPVSTLRDTILSRTNCTHARILYRGRTLSGSETLADVGMSGGESVHVLLQTDEELDALRGKKEDPLIRPFEKVSPRYVGVPRASKKERGCFGRVECLPGLKDSATAMKILETLANHTGFAKAMRKRGWFVPLLKEMYPAGQVGVDPVCVLGYNVNKGQEIHMRLRTDDLEGFRDMYKIKQVLAHELAHIVHSEHNNEFKELMLQVEREANEADWTMSKGHVVGEGAAFASAGGPRGDDPLEHTSRASIGSPSGLHITERLGGQQLSHKTVSRLVSSYSSRQSECEGASASTMRNVDEQQSSKVAVEEGRMTHKDAARADNVRDDNKQNEKEMGLKTVSGVDALVAMGFERRMAVIALRESDGDETRAAEWIFGNANVSSREAISSTGDAQNDERVGRIRLALNDLQIQTESMEQLIITLDALHLYISNVLRNPGNDRYRQINGANALFQRRVGRFEGALALLTESGFQPQDDGSWRLASADAAKLWLTKTIIQQQLVQQLQHSKG